MKKNLLMLSLLALIAVVVPLSAMDDECIGDECYYNDDIVYMGDDCNGDCDYYDYY